MNKLVVTRLLQNPLGAPAPAGQRGDMVRVSDGTVSIYLTPNEFDTIDAQRLGFLLAQRASDTAAHAR